MNKQQLKVVNLTCLINVGLKLDLNFLELFLDNARLDQSAFNALIVKLNQTTILLFKTGKGVITGAKKRVQAKNAALMLTEKLRGLQYEDAHLKSFKVTNIVISSKTYKQLNLEDFYNAHKLHSSYEIEIFPGLIYSEARPESTTIFRNGSFFVTGFSNFLKARNHTKMMYNKLLDFEK